MAFSREISWGDGSGDKIYLTGAALEGNQTVLVSSDANTTCSDRTKSVAFTTTVGNITKILTVNQEAGSDGVSITFNDVCITFNDVGIAYPYVEEYIVFVDDNPASFH